MEFNQRTIQICLVLIVIRGTFSNLDVPKRFCGKHLSNFLGTHCKLHNSPSDGVKLRVRRSIVEECCRRPCSQKYLLCNYCADPNETCGNTNDIPSKRVNEEQNRKHPNEIVQEYPRKSTDDPYSRFNINTQPCYQRYQHRRIRSTFKCKLHDN